MYSAACILLLAACCTGTANGQTEKESTNNEQSVRKGEKKGKESANSFHEDFPWKRASKGEDYHFYGELEMCGGKHFLYLTSISVLYSFTMKCYISCFK